MAETQTVSTSSETPLISKKNPVGRPRKDGQPAGSPPTSEGISVPEGDFFLALMGLEPTDWNYLSIYVYRVKPITDRAGGKYKYITKYSELIDVDRLMRDQGSGCYRLDLLESGKSKGGRLVSQTYVDIVNMDHPPKIEAGEWLDDPRNSDWAWCRGKVKNSSGTAAASPGDMADALLKMQQAVTPKQSEAGILAAIAPLLDPQRQIDMMATFAQLIPKPTPPQEDKTTGLLLTMMLEDRKAMREEMKELRAQLASKPTEKSPIEWLLEHEDLGRRIFGRGGANGPGSEGKTWVDIAEKTIEKLGPALVPLAQAGATMMIRGSSSPQQPQAPGRPPITVQPAPANLPAAQPAQAAAPQQQTEAPAAPGPTQENPENMNALSFAQKYGQVIQAASPFLLDLYLNGGEFGGYEFRDWFMNRYGNQLWNALRNEAGVDGMLQVAKFNPEYWKQLEPEEKFKAFMTDFFTPFGKERPGYDDEDDDFEAPPEGADNAA
jgi:hypothetical protein